MTESTANMRKNDTSETIKTKRFNMIISPDLYNAVDQASEADHMSMASWVRQAMQNELRRRENDYRSATAATERAPSHA